MIKSIFSFLIIAAVISSCGNTGNNEVASATDGSENTTKVEFAVLADNPDTFVGKNILVEGKVVHVCTHSGKKLFIVGENPDVRLFITAGEDMPKFPMELLGSQVVVEGTITKTGGPATAVAEAAPKDVKMTKTTTDEACETETALAAQVSLTDIIMEYKSHTVK